MGKKRRAKCYVVELPDGRVIRMRADNPPPEGLTPEQLAEALANVPPMCAEIHYGPGPFSHRGCAEAPDYAAMAAAIWPLIAADRQRGEAERDEEVERAHWGLVDHIHPGPDGCPTWYDGCNCNLETLTHNIRRAEVAEARCTALEEAFGPGTPQRIIAEMFKEAEHRGHDPLSSRHAMSFLLKQLDALQDQVEALVGIVRDVIGHPETGPPDWLNCSCVPHQKLRAALAPPPEVGEGTG